MAAPSGLVFGPEVCGLGDLVMADMMLEVRAGVQSDIFTEIYRAT